MNEVEVICEEKKLAEILGKTRLLMLAQGFVLFFEHQRGRTKVILDPSQVCGAMYPRPNLLFGVPKRVAAHQKVCGFPL